MMMMIVPPLSLLLLVVQLFAAAFGTSPSGGRWVQDEFAISFFVQSGPPPGNAAAFQLVKDGNFTVVGLYDHLHKDDKGNSTEQLQLCKQYGIKCIVALSDFKTPSGGLDPALPQPSTTNWGFYLADEPSGRTFSSLAAEVAAVRKAAPGALSFINLLPSNVSGRGKGTNAARWAREWGAPNYTAYVRALVDVVDPDVVCFDHYPTFGRNVAGKRENDTREDYVRNLALAGGVTWEAGIPLWQYFNIVPYGGRHEDPTEAQVRWQIATSLAYGVTGLLYFEWHPMADGHPGLVMSAEGQPTPGPQYFVAQRLNSWVLALSPYLLQAKPTGVVDLRYDRDADPASVLAAAPSAGKHLLVNVTRGDWTVGNFALQSAGSGSSEVNGTLAVMIVNFEHAYTQWATVEWRHKVLEVDGVSGQRVSVLDDAPDIAGLQLRFEAGQGRLFVSDVSQHPSL